MFLKLAYLPSKLRFEAKVKLRIERAKFQFFLIVFLQWSSAIVQLSHKKTMDSDESDHESYCTFVEPLMRQCVK